MIKEGDIVRFSKEFVDMYRNGLFRVGGVSNGEQTGGVLPRPRPRSLQDELNYGPKFRGFWGVKLELKSMIDKAEIECFLQEVSDRYGDEVAAACRCRVQDRRPESLTELSQILWDCRRELERMEIEPAKGERLLEFIS
jgi:hypothetical protein